MWKESEGGKKNKTNKKKIKRVKEKFASDVVPMKRRNVQCRKEMKW